MKKLNVLFALAFSVVVLAGCGSKDAMTDDATMSGANAEAVETTTEATETEEATNEETAEAEKTADEVVADVEKLIDEASEEAAE